MSSVQSKPTFVEFTEEEAARGADFVRTKHGVTISPEFLRVLANDVRRRMLGPHSFSDAKFLALNNGNLYPKNKDKTRLRKAYGSGIAKMFNYRKQFKSSAKAVEAASKPSTIVSVGKSGQYEFIL